MIKERLLVVEVTHLLLVGGILVHIDFYWERLNTFRFFTNMAS